MHSTLDETGVLFLGLKFLVNSRDVFGEFWIFGYFINLKTGLKSLENFFLKFSSFPHKFCAIFLRTSCKIFQKSVYILDEVVFGRVRHQIN